MLRNEYSCRPAIVALSGLILGLCSWNQFWPVAALLILLVVADRWSVRITLLCFVAIGLVIAPREVISTIETGRYELAGRVTSVPIMSNFGSRFELTSKGERLQIRTSEFFSPTPGEVLLLEGSYRPLNPEEGYLRSRGVSGVVNIAGSETRTLSVAPWWQNYPYQLQRHYVRLSNYIYGRDAGAWISALCLNQTGGLEEEATKNLRNSGVYHLVSASGIHVSVLAVISHFLLSFVPIRRGWHVLFIGGLLLFYTLMTGFHEATVRASVMWVLGFSHYLFRREADALQSLAVAGLGWLLFHPESLTMPGFQLSYLVTGALIFFRGVQLSGSGFSKVFQAIRVSCVASLASEPLIAWWFGQVCTVSIATNLLVGLCSSVLIVLGLISLVIGSFWLSAGEWIAHTLAIPVLDWIRLVVDSLAQLNWATFRLDRFPAEWLAIYYLAWILVWSPKPMHEDALEDEVLGSDLPEVGR